MGEFHVNIYIETSIKGPVIREAAGEWIVEYVTNKGIPVTRGGVIWRKKTTENALTLELIKIALSTLVKTCTIRVFTQCAHILSTVNNHWLPQWEKNGWINAKGKTVGNVELWQQVYGMMQNHFVEVCPDGHAYQEIMKHDIKKEMRKDHEKT